MNTTPIKLKKMKDISGVPSDALLYNDLSVEDIAKHLTHWVNAINESSAISQSICFVDFSLTNIDKGVNFCFEISPSKEESEEYQKKLKGYIE